MKFLANLFGSQSADAKTLEQSRAQLAAAKLSAEAVAALFTTAGLDLDALLAAGSDSLKAHVTQAAELIAGQQTTIADLKGQLAKATESLTTTAASLSATTVTLNSLGASFGYTFSATSTAADAQTALAAHVKKEAALELAKGGHRPVVADVKIVETKAAIDPGLTGMDRVRAAFAVQFQTAK